MNASSVFVGFSVERIHFRPTVVTTGCSAAYDVRFANGNYFEGGFLQIVFGADFEHGISPDFSIPTEFVNWTNNYANDSRHTVFGFYGSAVGTFANHMGTNAYGTIYRNYVNNSRYIAIQSSGNVSGLRVIGNYIRGPSPFPSGSPIFEFAISSAAQSHDTLITRNYLWAMDSTKNVGIVLVSFVYNVTVSNNVMYDVGGNFFRIDGLGLKYRKASDNSEASDYSWKGMEITLIGNYMAGGTHDRAILIGSGYVKLIGNAIVNGPASGHVDIQDDWDCHPDCSYVWVDWIDGFPDSPSIRFPIGNESAFWVRSMRSGGLIDALPAAIASFTVSMTTAQPTHFGALAARCVDNSAGTGGHTTTDAEVLAWSGHSCLSVADATAFVFSDAVRNLNAFEPERWYNKTQNLSFAPVIGTVSGTQEIEVTEPGSGYVLSNERTWTVYPGHSYVIAIPTITTRQFTDGLIIFSFMAVIVLVVMGAVWLRHRFA